MSYGNTGPIHSTLPPTPQLTSPSTPLNNSHDSGLIHLARCWAPPSACTLSMSSPFWRQRPPHSLVTKEIICHCLLPVHPCHAAIRRILRQHVYDLHIRCGHLQQTPLPFPPSLLHPKVQSSVVNSSSWHVQARTPSLDLGTRLLLLSSRHLLAANNIRSSVSILLGSSS